MPTEIREVDSTGSSLIWAVTFLIIIGIIVGALYYSGFLGSVTKGTKENTTINVETSAPAR
jgi:hypothetical protein